MYGNECDPGIVHRVAQELLKLSEDAGRKSVVSASMCEMHNSEIVDLLSSTPEKVGLKRDCIGASQLDGMHEQVLHTATDVMDVLTQGLSKRRQCSHVLNQVSSRSHAILTLKVRSDTDHGAPKEGKILLCDLGGCERLKRTRVDGVQAKESIEINKALSALRGVLQAVARGSRCVPYREHKLTELLRDSIGGTAKTLMLVTCSPAGCNLAETAAALRFASVAKRVHSSIA